MVSGRKYLIWDFDGTLGYRPGCGLVDRRIQVLERFAGMRVDPEIVRPYMRRGFPWHTPDQPNPAGRASDVWWEGLRPLFEEAFIGCRVPADQARDLSCKVRSVYTNIDEWRLFDDTVEILEELRGKGWRHAILSNHVPELPSLIDGLGLGSLIDHIVNSADTGFEKPHPGAFQAVLTALGDLTEVWMIGDNINADVLGAEALGIRAILVRTKDPQAQRQADNLRDVQRFLA